MELFEEYLCGILEKYCANENCVMEELPEIWIVESIWAEIENLCPDMVQKLNKNEIDKCDGYTLFPNNETGLVLIDKTFLSNSTEKNYCWIEVLIHEITHYRDYKSNLGIFGHDTYDSMLSCCPFWYWTEFHARYKGTYQMLDYVSKLPDDYKMAYEVDILTRIDNILDFIKSDAKKEMRCYRFMHLLGDIAAYNEKGFTIQSEAIERIFPDYLGYIDFLKSKDQSVDINFLTILRYHLEKNIS